MTGVILTVIICLFVAAILFAPHHPVNKKDDLLTDSISDEASIRAAQARIDAELDFQTGKISAEEYKENS